MWSSNGRSGIFESETLRRSMLDDMRRMMSSSLINTDEQERVFEQEKKEPIKMVEWDDVVGLDDAKQAIKEVIEDPFNHKDIFEAFNINPSKGILLWGPPGNGKTMLGKACATAISKLHNKNHADGFIYKNGAEMFAPHVGAEEKWVREVFEEAEQFYKNNGYPAVVFFDEADSMLPHRKKSPPWTKNAVNQFLSCVDGFKKSNVFIILATNNYEDLDEAAIRPGRIDRLVYVGSPTKSDVLKLIEKSFSNKPCEKNLILSVYSELTKESLFIEDMQFIETLQSAHVVSIADRAAYIAFQKAIVDSKCSKKPVLMITKEHAAKAINDLFKEVSQKIQAQKQGEPNIVFNTFIQGEKDSKEDF